MSTNTASVVAAIGTTGTGKSAWVKLNLSRKPPRRLLIWDPQGEYAGHGTVYRDRAALFAAVKSAKAFRAIYQPGDRLSLYGERFNWFCRLAYALGDLRMIVEELADVTTPSRAPEGWSVACRKGRHRGLAIVAASQRPAGVDKDFFGNCTAVHCGRLVYEHDLRVMGAVLGVDAERLKALPDLAYIERDMRSGEVREGRITFPATARPART